MTRAACPQTSPGARPRHTSVRRSTITQRRRSGRGSRRRPCPAGAHRAVMPCSVLVIRRNRRRPRMARALPAIVRAPASHRSRGTRAGAPRPPPPAPAPPDTGGGPGRAGRDTGRSPGTNLERLRARARPDARERLGGRRGRHRPAGRSNVGGPDDARSLTAPGDLSLAPRSRTSEAPGDALARDVCRDLHHAPVLGGRDGRPRGWREGHVEGSPPMVPKHAGRCRSSPPSGRTPRGHGPAPGTAARSRTRAHEARP